MSTAHCVEIGAVSFINKAPVLSVAESHQLAYLEVFRRAGAAFLYCEQPDPDDRVSTGAPCFNMTKHEVVSFDASENIVHARLLWDSLEDFERDNPNHRPGIATVFRYENHPTTFRPQWLRYKPNCKDLWAGVKCKGDIVLEVAGPVPATCVPYITYWMDACKL